MKFGVLGTGDVGRMIASKLVANGHEVMLGSRTADNEKAAAWVGQMRDGLQGEHGKGEGAASQGTFADAAAFGEMVWNCTGGMVSLAVIEMAGADNLADKILVDLSNPLDFSKGFPPRLSVSNDDSLGEAIQRALPRTKVVKTLNTMANPIMVDPGRLAGPHDVFVSGNDAEAKAAVEGLLVEEFGWSDPIDLGDITTARGTEAWLLLWTRLFGALGTADFNLHLVRGTPAEED